MTAVYVAAVISAVVLAAFVSYYLLRLSTASRGSDDLDRRLARLVPPPTEPADQAPDARVKAPPRMLQRPAVGLGQIYPEPVFLRREKAGTVTFQAEGRPSMPLKFLLDSRSRAMLERVVTIADKELGASWALLAQEDEQDRLLLTLL